MARKPGRKSAPRKAPARKRNARKGGAGRKGAKRGVVRLRWLGALLLLALVGLGWGWWALRHWQPPRAAWPVQGVEIGRTDGEVDWTALKAVGADFAYLDASTGAASHDAGFVDNLEAARAAGLTLGAPLPPGAHVNPPIPSVCKK